MFARSSSKILRNSLLYHHVAARCVQLIVFDSGTVSSQVTTQFCAHTLQQDACDETKETRLLVSLSSWDLDIQRFLRGLGLSASFISPVLNLLFVLLETNLKSIYLIGTSNYNLLLYLSNLATVIGL
ncbi:hypothetical protein ACJX0J_011274, partial [Zea mays]